MSTLQDDQQALSQLWKKARKDGCLPPWEQARVFGFKEAWEEMNGDKTYGRNLWIAERVSVSEEAPKPRTLRTKEETRLEQVKAFKW